MNRAGLLEALAAVDWSHTRSAARDTSDYVPDAFRRLLDASTDSEADSAYWLLDNRVVVQGNLFEAAERLVPLLLGALRLELSRPARNGVVELLTEIALGYTSPEEQARGNAQLEEKCRTAVRQGLEEIYAVLADPDARNRRAALYILDKVELERPRLAAVAASLAKSDPDEKVRTLAADQLRTAD